MCHATLDILTFPRLKVLSVMLVLIILIIVIISFIEMARTYHPIFIGDFVSEKTALEAMVKNCSEFSYRNNRVNFRLLCDIIGCLVIPSSISAFFYIQICRVLLNRDRDLERNRDLSVAFFLNWLFLDPLLEPLLLPNIGGIGFRVPAKSHFAKKFLQHVGRKVNIFTRRSLFALFPFESAIFPDNSQTVPGTTQKSSQFVIP